MLRNFIFLLFLCFAFMPMQAQWSTVCSTGDGFVDNFEVHNNQLYATGFFTTICGSNANHVVKYDGNTWTQVGSGHPFAGHQLKSIDNDLYFVAYQPNIDSNWVYKFDGTNFIKFGDGVYLSNANIGFSQTANLYSIHKHNGKIFVGGEFDRVGNQSISGIMQWNGNTWDSLGAGFSGNITGTASVMYPHDMCTFGTDLIVAGNFKKAGGIDVDGIARWDGTQWHAMGSGFNNSVYGVCVYNNELYACGEFTASGSTVLKYIAKWDGSNWIDPGFRMYYIGPFAYTFLHTLKVINNTLYIAGGFNKAEFGTNVYNCQAVCAYNGTSIDTLYGGITGNEIEAIALFNNELYVGGGQNNGNSYVAKLQGPNAIQPIEQEQGLKIFPSPSKDGHLRIESQDELLKLDVYDVEAKLVWSATPRSTKYQFQLLKSGLYFARIQTHNGIKLQKFIVQE